MGGKMNRTECPKCGQQANTFPVDSCGWLKIRLCLPCAKEEGFKVDISKTKKCPSCGKLFNYACEGCSRVRYYSGCPVCYIKSLPKRIVAGDNLLASKLPTQRKLIEVINGRSN